MHWEPYQRQICSSIRSLEPLLSSLSFPLPNFLTRWSLLRLQMFTWGGGRKKKKEGYCWVMAAGQGSSTVYNVRNETTGQRFNISSRLRQVSDRRLISPQSPGLEIILSGSVLCLLEKGFDSSKSAEWIRYLIRSRFPIYFKLQINPIFNISLLNWCKVYSRFIVAVIHCCFWLFHNIPYYYNIITMSFLKHLWLRFY